MPRQIWGGETEAMSGARRAAVVAWAGPGGGGQACHARVSTADLNEELQRLKGVELNATLGKLLENTAQVAIQNKLYD